VWFNLVNGYQIEEDHIYLEIRIFLCFDMLFGNKQIMSCNVLPGVLCVQGLRVEGVEREGEVQLAMTGFVLAKGTHQMA